MFQCKAKPVYGILFMLVAFLPVSCTKSLTVTNIVYENNFDDRNLKDIVVSGWNTNGGFGPVTDPRIGNYNGQTVLGKLNNNLVQLSLFNLPPHQALRVEFDLYLHNQWNNELWAMSFDGSYQLITGFSNDSTIKQSYPNWIGNGTPLTAAGADAINTRLPGVCNLINSAHGSSMYRMITTIQHSSNQFVLNCNDAGGAFNDTCRRSWSMDNLKISVFKN